MDFRDIEYFAVLAKYGNVARAAESLNLSPPALSVSLRRLETSMQTKLFRRTPKGVEMTPTGTALFAQVTKMRLTRDDVLREAADLTEGRAGYLRVGTGPGLSVHLLPAACADLLKEAPRVNLDVIVADRIPLIESIRNGELDLAVTYLPPAAPKGLSQEYLCDDVFTVYCSPQHPFAKKKHVTIKDLAQSEWAMPSANIDAMSVLIEAIQTRALPMPTIRIASPSIQIRHHIIASSSLLGFSSTPVLRSTPQYKFVELRVKELNYRRRSGVVYRSDGYLSPAGRRFVEILKQIATPIAGGKAETHTTSERNG